MKKRLAQRFWRRNNRKLKMSDMNVKANQAEETPQEEAPQSVFADKTVEACQQKQAELEETIAQLNDRYLRLRADFENYRRRMAKEFAEERAKASQQTVSEFLNVHDYLMMAREHFGQGADLEQARQGLEMILNEFQKTFDNLGVKRIEAVGQDFDPNLHEAVGREPTTEMAEGKVLRQWKPGFEMNGKLLRPATVVVAVAPAETQAAPAESPAADAPSEGEASKTE